MKRVGGDIGERSDGGKVSEGKGGDGVGNYL